MKKWKDDDELFSLIKRELFTAVVGDILDKCGYLHQFLPAAIRPLAPQMVIVGRAMTVLEADVFEEEAANSANPVMRKPFGLMFEALDSLQRNEVYICSGASRSEEHTSELQSLMRISYAVFCLKKKKMKRN